MSKIVLSTTNAPAPIGPYSQGMRAGDFVFTSGQIPVDPTTGKLVEGGIGAQTHQVFANLKAVLQAGGASFAQVVKVQVFLANMDDFAAMNAVYAEYLTGDCPARFAVQVAKLPLGSLVEIDMTAYLG